VTAAPDIAAFLVSGILGGMFTLEGMKRRGMAALTLIITNLNVDVEGRNFDKAVKS
jgi:hypothetical protein